MQYPRIAIIGGGPAGLTAAVIFHRHGWPVTVFESDASATERDQGGTLDLHPEEGQFALQKAGLLDAFMAIARHEDQGQRVVEHATGEMQHEYAPPPGKGERPEIDRIVLRQLLLNALDDRTMRWGARVLDVTDHPGGEVGLQFAEEVAGPFDLVIGADGAWSRVRAAVSDVQPAYTGVTFAELWLSDVDVRHPQSAALVGHGTMFALHNGAGIIAQRNGGGTIRVYAAFRTSREEGDRPDRTFAGITIKELLARFEGWAVPLRDLIARADLIAAVRPIVALPPGFCWSHRSGLALIGDAAHVMPPLGVGVNLAMLDAAELAEMMVKSADWRGAARSAETAMLARAAEAASDCGIAFAEMFSADGQTSTIDHFESRVAQGR